VTETALVLGATGSFGGGVARELLRRSRPVRALVRDAGTGRRALGEHPALTLTQGDVQDPVAVTRVAEGCRVIVHGVNYPYDQWVPDMERATTNIIAAARAAGATILFPGNVYGLGPQTSAPLTEAAPNEPRSRKGALRVTLEESLRQAAADGRTRVIVLRAGDYFGPTVRNGLVDPIFGNAARGKTIKAIGKLAIAHQWAFIPDLARAAIDLLDLAQSLAPFEVVHFAGHVANPQREFLRLVAAQAGRPELAIRRIPMWMLRVVGLWDGVVRELWELRYLFEESVVLDGAKLHRLLPGYADTPIDLAVRATLASYGT
jgi:nucleoside-diphosphate-sugar epimerase